MSLAGKLGRLGQLYAGIESPYGTPPALTSAMAIRHLDVGFKTSPRNRVASPEKKQSPGTVNRLTRRTSAELASFTAMMYPSGVLQTAPEADVLYNYSFGAKAIRAISTTSPSSSINNATQSLAGSPSSNFAVGDLVLLGIGTARYVRQITASSSASGAGANLIKFTPGIPSGQSAADVIKGGVQYKLSTDITQSIFLAHYVGAFGRGLLGTMLDKMKMSFDSMKEPQFTLSGPAQGEQSTQGNGPFGTLQAKPGAFTTVGAGNAIPSGLTGGLYFTPASSGGLITGNMLKASMEIQNGLVVRNENYGSPSATEGYRSKRRTVPITMDWRVEDPTLLYGLAEATTVMGFSMQTGGTEGSIIGVVCPQVELEVPETPDGEEALTWSFTGTALESADGANDEMTLGFF